MIRYVSDGFAPIIIGSPCLYHDQRKPIFTSKVYWMFFDVKRLLSGAFFGLDLVDKLPDHIQRHIGPIPRGAMAAIVEYF